MKNEKENKNTDYHYVELPCSANFDTKYKSIKGKDKWHELRHVYKNKKEEQQDYNKDDRKHSFSLLIEAVNELVQ